MYDFAILFEEEQLDKKYQHFLFTNNYCWESGDEYYPHLYYPPYYILVENHRYVIGKFDLENIKKRAKKVYTSKQFKRKYSKKLKI